MSTLAVEEFKTTLTQTINFTYDRVRQIGGFKLKLFMFDAPVGTFTVSVKKAGLTLITKDFTSEDIKTDLNTTDNYAWIWKAILFDDVLAIKKGTYDIELSATGYTYSPISFIGWCKAFENIFNMREDDFIDYTTNPLELLVYERVREDLQR